MQTSYVNGPFLDVSLSPKDRRLTWRVAHGHAASQNVKCWEESQSLHCRVQTITRFTHLPFLITKTSPAKTASESICKIDWHRCDLQPQPQRNVFNLKYIDPCHTLVWHICLFILSCFYFTQKSDGFYTIITECEIVVALYIISYLPIM